MTKAKKLEAVVAAVKALNLGEAVNAKLLPVLDEHLAPKSGGATVDLSTVTKTENGKVTQVQCSVSGVWLPASLAFFYEDKSEKPRIVGVDGKGIKRLSKQAESVTKKFKKVQNASVKAITDDIIALDMSVPANVTAGRELKKKLEAEKAKKPDYSKVSATLQEA